MLKGCECIKQSTSPYIIKGVSLSQATDPIGATTLALHRTVATNTVDENYYKADEGQEE